MPETLPENMFARARCFIVRCRTLRVDKRDYAPSGRGAGRKDRMTSLEPYHDHRNAINEHHALIRCRHHWLLNPST